MRRRKESHKKRKEVELKEKGKILTRDHEEDKKK